MPTQTRLNGTSRLNTTPSSNGVGPTQPANGRGNSFQQDRLREQTQAGTCAMPGGDYVTMEGDGKAKYLAELFRTPEAQTTFNDRGFNGTDQWPTLEGFQQMVTDGDIHYFVGGGMGGPGGGTSSTSSQISEWVQSNFAQVTVDGATFYDLTQPVS